MKISIENIEEWGEQFKAEFPNDKNIKKFEKIVRQKISDILGIKLHEGLFVLVEREASDSNYFIASFHEHKDGLRLAILRNLFEPYRFIKVTRIS